MMVLEKEKVNLVKLVSTQKLVSSILPETLHSSFEEKVKSATSSFRERHTVNEEEEVNFSSQWDLDDVISRERFDTLLTEAHSPHDEARMLAARQPLASKWLQVFPNAQVGTTLTNSTFRVNVDLRLGDELCADHV